MDANFVKQMNKVHKLIEMFFYKDLFVNVQYDDINVLTIFFPWNVTHTVKWHPCNIDYPADYTISIKRIDCDRPYVVIDTSKLMSEHFAGIKIYCYEDVFDEWVKFIGKPWKQRHTKKGEIKITTYNVYGDVLIEESEDKRRKHLSLIR